MCGDPHIRAVSFPVPILRSIRDPFRVESIAEQYYRVMNDRHGLRLSLPRLPKVSLEPKFAFAPTTPLKEFKLYGPVKLDLRNFPDYAEEARRAIEQLKMREKWRWNEMRANRVRSEDDDHD